MEIVPFIIKVHFAQPKHAQNYIKIIIRSLLTTFLLSFLFAGHGEMLPSMLRPLVGPMRNPTSPKIAERLLKASKKANAPCLVPYN